MGGEDRPVDPAPELVEGLVEGGVDGLEQLSDGDYAAELRAAIQQLETDKVDILTLDMIMEPGIDGLETYKHILSIHPEQKAVIASGFSENDRVKQAQQLGAGEYVKKPYSFEKLGTAVKRELEKTA